MAALSLMTPAALLAELAPNVEPGQPSIWPLAPGYWLILTALLVPAFIILFRFYKRRHLRQRLRQLRSIRQMSDPKQQLSKCHQLLRWVSIHDLRARPGMSPDAFKRFIEEQTGQAAPSWLNQHYNVNSETDIDWQEARALVQALMRRAAA